MIDAALGVLSAGGDVAALVLVGLFWRLDRRILKLEIWQREHDRYAFTPMIRR